MYHYQKNIGDYRSATMHLSLLEHGVYNQLLDWYYLDENPLPLDNRTLFRRLSARTEAEEQAVIDVLSEMFTKTDEGWVHKRVEREISQYKAKAEQARQAGKLGGRPPKKGIGFENNRDGFENKPDAKPTDNRKPLTANQEPLTENQEPKTKSLSEQTDQGNETLQDDSQSKSPKNGTRLPVDWLLPSKWGQWALENTTLAESEIRLEAEKFKDHWLANANRAAGRKADWLAAWRNWVRNAKPDKTLKTKTQQILANNDKAIHAFIEAGQVIEGEVVNA